MSAQLEGYAKRLEREPRGVEVGIQEVFLLQISPMLLINPVGILQLRLHPQLRARSLRRLYETAKNIVSILVLSKESCKSLRSILV